MKPRIFLSTLAVFLFTLTSAAQEKIIIVDEGVWQTDNGRLSYFENGRMISNQWFRDINGHKLGDTPNDIIQINDNLLAIALNWSNIIQFITPQGRAVSATEDIPNNRCLASDGKYLYATSFGHEVAINGQFETFTKGYVAKIDVNTFKTVAAVEVGYEPEGIAYYNGKLFVANTGGYAFEENHDYEKTISIIDAATMRVTRTINTGYINLSSKMSRAGKYLCVSSPGDYYDTETATVIIDCEAVIAGKPDSQCFATFNRAATCNTATSDGKFLAVGSRYSFYTGNYVMDYLTIDPAVVMSSGGTKGFTATLPGALQTQLAKMTRPYALYVNPYTGYIYATDAGSNIDAGKLYQFSADGNLLGTFKTYINPGHILALPPDGHFDGVDEVSADTPKPADGTIYDLRGIRVTKPIQGQIYIRDGKKFIYSL